MSDLSLVVSEPEAVPPEAIEVEVVLVPSAAFRLSADCLRRISITNVTVSGMLCVPLVWWYVASEYEYEYEYGCARCWWLPIRDVAIAMRS